MEPSVDKERLDDYQARVTTWIGKQGLFFQIRYLGLTRAGSIGARLASLMVILVVMALVVALLLLGALKLYQKSEWYQEKLEAQIGQVLGTESLKARGFEQSRGNLGFQSLSLSGGEKSFFYEAKLTGVEGPFPFLTGAWTEWSPGQIVIEKADFNLKAGGGQEEMKEALSGVVKTLGGAAVTRIKIDDFSCEWGYSKLTLGGIYHSKLDAVLVDGRWTVLLEGGKFRQNWMGPFEIERGELVIDRDGILVESFRLREGAGILDLAGRVEGPSNNPTFDLRGKFSKVPVDSFLHVEGITESRFVEGTISGELEVSGSTNRRIQTTGRVVLTDEDEVMIRDQWRLLRAISAVVKDGTYLRIEFGSGSFDFSTDNGGCEITNIDLVSEGAARLKGGFSTRLPSQKEAAQFLEISLTDGFSESLTDTSSAKRMEDDRISIGRAARTDDEEFKIELIEESIEDAGVASSRQVKQWDGYRLQREMKKHRFTGDLQLALPHAVLLKNERVVPFYLPDEQGWSWIPVDLKDVTFSEISESAGQKLMKEGQDYLSNGAVSGDGE